jgi:hypothetical protein
MCMYLLVTRSLVIEEHKGFSPFQTRDRAERDQIMPGQIMTHKGCCMLSRVLYKAIKILFAHYYILSIATMSGGVSDVPSKFLRPCNASKTSSSHKSKHS